MESQDKAAAIVDGCFQDEIVPIVIMGRKGEKRVDVDEGPRFGKENSEEGPEKDYNITDRRLLWERR